MTRGNTTLGTWLVSHRYPDNTLILPAAQFWKSDPVYVPMSELSHGEVIAFARHTARNLDMRARIEVRGHNWQVLFQHCPEN